MKRAQRYLACRPRQSKPDPHRLCAACRVRPARFRFRGRVKADKSHTLCMKYFRSMCDGLGRGRLRRRPPIRPADRLESFHGTGTPPGAI